MPIAPTPIKAPEPSLRTPLNPQRLQALEAEGIDVDDEYKVKISDLLWQPIPKNQNSLL